jgi:hypothetical protein
VHAVHELRHGRPLVATWLERRFDLEGSGHC